MLGWPLLLPSSFGLCLLRSPLPRDRERLLLADFPGISAREASARHRLSSSRDAQYQ